MYALGIDIGTTYTAAATWRHGHAEIATLGEQAAAIPSVVLASVLRKRDTGFDILGTPEGIQQLGGIDIDAAVYDHVSHTVGDSIDELDEDDPAAVAAVARLKQECVDGKQALSSDTDVAIPVLLPTITTEVRLTRAELEAMVRPTVYVTIEALRRALESARVAPEELHSVLLVGGSSRIPLVAQLVGSEFGCPVAVDAHPKHAVALGAALLAGADVASQPESGGSQESPVVQQPPAPLPTAQPQAATEPPAVPRSPTAASTPEVAPPLMAPGSQFGTLPDRQAHGEPTTEPVRAPGQGMARGTQQTSAFAMGTSRRSVVIAVVVTIMVAATVGGWWWSERAGWWSDSAASTDSGSGADTATDAADIATRNDGTGETSAAKQLVAMVRYDRADVRLLFGKWVPQLSAKWVGLDIDGKTYDLAAILSDHERLRQRYDTARILWSGDYPVFRRDNAYVTIAAVTFDTSAEANGWCETERIPADDCFAKFIDSEGDWEGATQFR